MEIYPLTLRHSDTDRTMYFLYIKDTVDIHHWEKEVYHEYYKINVFIHVDADVIKGEQKYSIKNTGILYYKPFESHFGTPSYTQTAEYFEFLIPRRFFSFTDGEDVLEKLSKSAEMFSMDAQRYHILIELLFTLRDKFKRGTPDLLLLGSIINVIDYLCAHQQPLTGLPLDKHLSSRLLDLINFIDSHCGEITSIEELAAQFKMSVSYMCRLFRDQLSTSPYKYLTEKRLEHAKDLLCSGASVIDAALDSGFYGSSVFIQRFKKKYGVTPNEYKKLYFSAK